MTGTYLTALLYFLSLHCALLTLISLFSLFFFFNDTATTEIYTLSLHDALPISRNSWNSQPLRWWTAMVFTVLHDCIWLQRDRKSTRLNSSHTVISYAVFCLKKKKHNNRKTSS